VIHSFDAGKAVQDITGQHAVSGDAIINIVQAVCYTNELAAGTKFMWYTL
jgi:hypothetical protein